MEHLRNADYAYRQDKNYKRDACESIKVQESKDEAEAYMAEMENCEMDEKDLDKVAGGVCWSNCPTESSCAHHVCGTVGWENFKGC